MYDGVPSTLACFGSGEPAKRPSSLDAFDLKKQVVDLFAIVRSLEAAEILNLEIRHGLPYDLEIERRS